MRLGFVVCSSGLAALFILAPGIDLWFSDLFYESGRGFYLHDVWWAAFIHRAIPLIAALAGIGFAGLLAVALIRKQSAGIFRARTLVYLLITLALGPGLTVNTVFKDQWGRARPRQIAEYGGEAVFTPAFVISDQCDRNCSFVAGHPSVAFYFLSLGLLARRRRLYIYGGASAAGAIVGLGRIVQGAHFLSDVVFSGVFTFLVAYLLYYLFRLKGSTAS